MIDLYGGSANVWIRSGGQARTIHSLAGKGSASVNDPSFTNFVSRINVSISLVRFIQIEVELNPTYEEAIALINSGNLGFGFKNIGKTGSNVGDGVKSAGIINGLNELIVSLSYGGLSSRQFKGIMLNPEIDASVDGFTITLRAVGYLFQASRSGNNKVYKDMTKGEVVKDLVGDGENVRLVFDDDKSREAFSKAFTSNENKHKGNAFFEILSEAGLVHRDIGVENVNDIPVIQIFSRDKIRSQPKVTFSSFTQIDPSNRNFPLLSFRTNLANVIFGHNFGTKIKSFFGEDEDVTNLSDSQQTAQLQDGSMPGASDDDEKVKNFPDNVNKSEGTAQYSEKMKGFMHEMLDSVFTYEITSVGVFDLLPGIPVDVRVGDAKFLTGSYDCLEIEHELSTDGASTRMKLSKTAGITNKVADVQKGLERVILNSADKVSQPKSNLVSKVSSSKGLVGE